MNLTELLVLFSIMVALAAVPSTSVAFVVVRSATLGVTSGIAAAGGIVVADLVFVNLAMFGLSAIAETMGSLFSVVKLCGALYLLWLGFSILKTKGGTRSLSENRGRSEGKPF